jgi:mycoredoxin
VAEQLTVFWRPGCPFCLRLRARLAMGRVPYEARNVHEDPAAAAEVRSVNGGDELVPTVRIGTGRYLSNPSYREVVTALRG